MKKFLMILGGICVAIVLVLVIFAVIFIPRALKLNREGVACIQEAVPRIAEKWNSQELLDRATPELVALTQPREKFDAVFVMYRQLGALKSLGTPTGSVGSSTFAGQGTKTIGNFTAQAEFEKGSGVIEIQLQRIDGAWKINGFRINSDVFLPKAGGATGTTPQDAPKRTAT